MSREDMKSRDSSRSVRSAFNFRFNRPNTPLTQVTALNAIYLALHSSSSLETQNPYVHQYISRALEFQELKPKMGNQTQSGCLVI